MSSIKSSHLWHLLGTIDWRICFLFLAPLFLFLPVLASAPFPNAAAEYSDLQITHLPAAEFLRRSILEDKAVPLWYPQILSGHPFAANPLSGLWYPPGWLALLFPLPLGFNLVAALHLGWGGVGVYHLLRNEGVQAQAALFGGLAFAFLPKLFAHYGAGHLTLIYAVPWTPWLLLFGQSSVALVSKRVFALRAVRAGLILAVIFMADPRWVPYAVFAWVPYRLFFGWRGWKEGLAFLSLGAVFAGFFAAPLGLPLLEFTRLSTRASLSPLENSVLAFPLTGLAGLVFPSFGGEHEWVLYPGAVIFLLVGMAVLWKGIHPRGRFWLGMAVLSLLLAFGPLLPFNEWIARLPGLSLLRVPARSLFVLGLALAMVSAHALQHILTGLSSVEVRRASLFSLGITVLVVLLAGGLWAVAGEILPGFAWGALWFSIFFIWIRPALSGRYQPTVWFIGLLILSLFDIAGAARGSLSFRPGERRSADSRAAVLFLVGKPGRFRVYSPSYSLPQHIAARYRVELVDGVDPLQLQSYAQFLEKASGVPYTRYSVTLPPFSDGKPATANRSYQPDPVLLGYLNTQYILAAYEISSPGLVPVARFGELHLYRNPFALPRAWTQSITSPLGDGAEEVRHLEWHPNQIGVEVSPSQEDRLLVLSELSYPGWRASINGESVDLVKLDVPLRAVMVPAGAQKIVFQFRPTSLYAGLTLAGLAWCAMLFTAWSVRKEGRAVGFMLRRVDAQAR